MSVTDCELRRSRIAGGTSRVNDILRPLPPLTLDEVRRRAQGSSGMLDLEVWNAADGSAGPVWDGRCKTEGCRREESGLEDPRRVSLTGSYLPDCELKSSLGPLSSRHDRLKSSAAISLAGEGAGGNASKP